MAVGWEGCPLFKTLTFEGLCLCLLNRFIAHITGCSPQSFEASLVPSQFRAHTLSTEIVFLIAHMLVFDKRLDVLIPLTEQFCAVEGRLFGCTHLKSQDSRSLISLCLIEVGVVYIQDIIPRGCKRRFAQPPYLQTARHLECPATGDCLTARQTRQTEQ